MREPDLDSDGWSLDDGEARHRDAPETFWIPQRAAREALQPGDYAKLIFRIALEQDEIAFERMWVIVRGRLGNTYFGRLDNEPTSIEENDDLWLGTEVPFRAEHVIDIDSPTKESVDLARQPPRRPWRRD